MILLETVLCDQVISEEEDNEFNEEEQGFQ